MLKKINEAAEYLVRQIGAKAKTAIVLGSGLILCAYEFVVQIP